MAGTVRARLEAALLEARRGRDALRVDVLRTTLAALSNAEAVAPADVAADVTETPRRELSEEESLAIVRAERAELLERSAEMASVAQQAEAERLVEKAAVLEQLLAD